MKSLVWFIIGHLVASVSKSLLPHSSAATLSLLLLVIQKSSSARLDVASAVPLGTPHEQINDSAARLAGAKPVLLEPPLIPLA